MFRFALRRFALGLALVFLMTVPLFLALHMGGAHGSQICLATTAGCGPTPNADQQVPKYPYAP